MDEFCKKIIKKTGKAINQYNLIKADDSVLVALSGGKDSLTLLETITLRLKHLPIKYDVAAMHITVENIPYEIDNDYMSDFCKSLGVPYYKKSINVDISSIKDGSPCFLCSWYRRKELFKAMKEFKCNKLALGHHLDDAIETLIMNMIFEGSFSTMPPKVSMFDNEFDIIRPLFLIDEKDIDKYASIRGFKRERKTCPYKNKSTRNTIKSIVREFESISINARQNIFSSMSNIKTGYLPERLHMNKRGV